MVLPAWKWTTYHCSLSSFIKIRFFFFIVEVAETSHKCLPHKNVTWKHNKSLQMAWCHLLLSPYNTSYPVSFSNCPTILLSFIFYAILLSTATYQFPKLGEAIFSKANYSYSTAPPTFLSSGKWTQLSWDVLHSNILPSSTFQNRTCQLEQNQPHMAISRVTSFAFCLQELDGLHFSPHWLSQSVVTRLIPILCLHCDMSLQLSTEHFPLTSHTNHRYHGSLTWRTKSVSSMGQVVQHAALDCTAYF